jgi:hypothetical protein
VLESNSSLLASRREIGWILAGMCVSLRRAHVPELKITCFPSILFVPRYGFIFQIVVAFISFLFLTFAFSTMVPQFHFSDMYRVTAFLLFTCLLRYLLSSWLLILNPN